MRIVSWNVNGIRAVERKELLPWDQMADADIFCLQETKARKEQVSPLVAEPDGFRSYWHSAKKPGYSGVAIYTRDEPDQVYEGMGNDLFDDEGRVIAVRFDDVVIISAYFPNSQDAGKRVDYKIAFCHEMETYLQQHLDNGHHICLTGDYNIAHTPIDLARPKENEKSAGYLPEERAYMTRYLGLGYHDVFREENEGREGCYTWWSYRGGARGRNVGWRIDYCTVNPGLRDRAGDARIHADIMGSDHCPVSIEIDL